MSLVTTKGMLLDARSRGYAVGAFNANNLEMAQGIVMAAEKENAPVIVQVSQGGAEHGGLEEMAAIVRSLAAKASVPVALHLDHGVDFVYNIRCLRVGFTSLMYDGSQLEFAENVRITREVVKAAHAVGVPVEAELGRVPKDPTGITLEDLKAYMTSPEEAVAFVEQTNVDSLAIAVGNMHKMKPKEAKIDIERIKAIRERVSVPLVLHGASGVPDEAVVEAVKAESARLMSTPNWARVLPRGFMKYLKPIRKPWMSASTWVKPGKPLWKRCGRRCDSSGPAAKPLVCPRFLLNRKTILNKR